MTAIKDVHTGHCCSKHGCKYSYKYTNDECTVVSGRAPQEHPCEYCDREREEVATWLPEATADELRAEWRSRGMDPDRAKRTFDVDVPCPNCGRTGSIFGYLYLNENGEHMHTHYVCRTWRKGEYKPCGWHGWVVR